MKRFSIQMVAVATLAMVASDAFAQPGGRGRTRTSVTFGALDTNKDGTISASELKAASKSLKALDKNKDGKITADEVRPPGMAERMMEMDKNKDGKITEKEAGERWRFLSRLDADKNGSVDKKEIDAMMERFRGRFGRGRGGDRGRPGGGGRPPERPDL